MKQVEARQKELEMQNRRLVIRIQQLELLAERHGLEDYQPTWQQSAQSSVTNSFFKSHPLLDQTLDGTMPQFSLPDIITEGSVLSAL